MKKVYDDFAEQLVYEIALSRDIGFSSADIEAAIKTFYKTDVWASNKTNANAEPDAAETFTARPPKTEERFIKSIWRRLKKHPDTEIRKGNGFVPPDLSSTQNASTQDASAQDAVTQVTAGSDGGTPDIEHLDSLPQNQGSQPQPSLKYPGKRVYATERRIWLAVAGHAKDYVHVPRKEFDLLCIIAGHGPEGVIQPDLSKIAGQDKRSVPKRTDMLANKGYIGKDKIIIAGWHTAVLKLRKYSVQGQPTWPKYLTAYPNARKLEDSRMVYYDAWFADSIRMIKANGGIITLEDLRIGLNIHESHLNKKALKRCVDRITETGLIRKLKVRVHEDDVPSDRESWNRCVQILREPVETDLVAFRGTPDFDGSKKEVRRKHRATKGKATERPDNQVESGDEDSELDSEAQAEAEDEVDFDALPTTSIGQSLTPRAVATSRPRRRASSAVAPPPDDDELEMSWLDPRLLAYKEGRASLAKITYPVAEGRAASGTHRRSSQAYYAGESVEDDASFDRDEWNFTSEQCRAAPGRNHAVARNPFRFTSESKEEVDSRRGSTTLTSRGVPARKRLKRGDVSSTDGQSPPRTFVPSTTASLSSTNRRRTHLTKGDRIAKLLAASKKAQLPTGVHIDPPGSKEARFADRHGSGRRPKSIIAVFRLDKLLDLECFRHASHEWMSSGASPDSRHDSSQEIENHLATEQARARPRADQTAARLEKDLGSAPKILVEGTEQQRSSAVERLPLISTPSPTLVSLEATGIATSSSDLTESAKKRKRGRSSTIELAERKKSKTGPSLIVKLPVSPALDAGPTTTAPIQAGDDPVDQALSPSSDSTEATRNGINAPETSAAISYKSVPAPKSRSTPTPTDIARRTGKGKATAGPNKHGTYNRDYTLRHPELKWKHRGGGRFTVMSEEELRKQEEYANAKEDAARLQISPSQTIGASAPRTQSEVSNIPEDTAGSYSIDSIPAPTTAPVTSVSPTLSPSAPAPDPMRTNYPPAAYRRPFVPTTESWTNVDGTPKHTRSSFRETLYSFPIVEGITVRRTAEGMAVYETSKLRTPTKPKNPSGRPPGRPRKVPVERYDVNVEFSKSLLMSPGQFFQAPSGTIGTVGTVSHPHMGSGLLEDTWKIYHRTPSDLQSILVQATQIGYEPLPDTESLGDRILREIDCVEKWEATVIDERIFDSLDARGVFVVHEAGNAFCQASQYPSPVKEDDFLPEAPPFTVGSVSKGRRQEQSEDQSIIRQTSGKQAATPTPSGTRSSSLRSRGRASRARGGASNAAKHGQTRAAASTFDTSTDSSHVVQSPTTAMQLVDGSPSGLYRGPDLPARPFLSPWDYIAPTAPQSLYTPPSELANSPLVDAVKRQRKPNTQRVSTYPELATDISGTINADAYNPLVEQPSQPKRDPSKQKVDCLHCLEKKTKCHGGSATERCGYCKLRRLLCSKVVEDVQKMKTKDRWRERLIHLDPELDDLHLQTTPGVLSNLQASQPATAGGIVDGATGGEQQSETPSVDPPVVSKRKPPFVYKGKAAAIRKSSGTATPTNLDDSDQEFVLSTTATPVPHSKGTPSFPEPQRLHAAIALVNVLFNDVQHEVSPNWDIVTHALAFRYDKATLQKRWRYDKRYKSDSVKKLQLAMREPFLQAYEKDETPYVDLENPAKTDWLGLLRWVEANITLETNVALEAKIAPSREDTEEGGGLHELPLCRVEFDKSFKIDRSSADAASKMTAAGANGRVGSPYDAEVSGSRDLRSDMAVAKSHVRATAMTRDRSYNEQEATRKLSKLHHPTLIAATAELEQSRTIARRRADRQLPGRNYIIPRDVLSEFKKWPGDVNEHKFLRDVAASWQKLVQHFQGNDTLDYDVEASGVDAVVLTQMLAQGQLKVTPILPDFDTDFVANMKKSDGTYNFRLVYKRSPRFVSNHPLRTNVTIPQQPTAPLQDALPFWIDIHGEFVDELWDMVLRSVLHVVLFHPGITTEGVERLQKGHLWAWEIEMVFCWMEEVGVIERWSLGHEDEIGRAQGWRTTEWWYCAFSPAVATWKQPRHAVSEV